MKSSTPPVLGAVFLAGLFVGCSGPESPDLGTGGTGGSGVGGAGGSGGLSAGGSSGRSAGGTGGTGGTGGSVGGASGSAGSGVGGVTGVGGATTGGTGGTGTGGLGTGGVGTGGAAAGTGGGSGATAGAGGTGPGGSGGSAGTGTTGNCNFTVASQTADKAGSGGIPTVGIVDWSTDLAGLTAANIVFSLEGGASYTAPVDIAAGPNFKTLLLGMKGSKTYKFHIEAAAGATTCNSMDYMITTGAVSSSVPRITKAKGTSTAAPAKGFIVASTGIGGMGAPGGGGTSLAFILDSDGDPVWWSTAPTQCSRAKMSTDGKQMWMASLNVQNGSKDGGQVDRITMDGLTKQTKIAGLSNCHHDLTVVPSGKMACLSWSSQSGDKPSDLIESDGSGTVTKIATIDSSTYSGNSFHANALHYHPTDKSYTISDRNPNLFVKISAETGAVIWQLGGSCSGAPASKCVAGDWKVNHGHDMLDDGTFLFFNNGQSGASTMFNYKITETGTFAAQMVSQYKPGTTSNVLGDVQRLPNGNTLVTFSTASIIHEIDSSNVLIQSWSGGAGGYAEWRETLYGPPARY